MKTDAEKRCSNKTASPSQADMWNTVNRKAHIKREKQTNISYANKKGRRHKETIYCRYLQVDAWVIWNKIKDTCRVSVKLDCWKTPWKNEIGATSFSC
jgi:hypothetical protein